MWVMLGSLIGSLVRIFIFLLLFKWIGKRLSTERKQSLIIGYVLCILVDLLLLISINGANGVIRILPYDMVAIILFAIFDVYHKPKKSTKNEQGGE